MLNTLAITENTATLEGYTRQLDITMGPYDLSLLVKPGTDYDSCFKAWDRDEQEFLWIKGWLIEDLNEAPLTA